MPVTDNVFQETQTLKATKRKEKWKTEGKMNQISNIVKR